MVARPADNGGEKEAGLLAQGRRTDLGYKTTQVDKFELSELGINKNLAKKARKLATLSDAEFESMIRQRRE